MAFTQKSLLLKLIDGAHFTTEDERAEAIAFVDTAFSDDGSYDTAKAREFAVRGDDVLVVDETGDVLVVDEGVGVGGNKPAVSDSAVSGIGTRKPRGHVG